MCTAIYLTFALGFILSSGLPAKNATLLSLHTTLRPRQIAEDEKAKKRQVKVIGKLMKIASLPDSCPLGVCHCHFLLEFLLPQSPLELVFQLLQFILGLLVKLL